MNWQLILVFQTILFGTSMITLRILARDKRTADASFSINAGMYIALYATMVCSIPAIGGAIHGLDLRLYWWRFILGGLAFALGNVFLYKTLAYFDAAIASITGMVSVLFIVAGAWLFLAEKLTLLQVAGASLLIAAIAYGVLATHVPKKRSARRVMFLGTTFAILSGLTTAAGLTNEKSLLGHVDLPTYILFGIGAQCLMSLLLGIIMQRRKLYILREPRVLGWSWASGILRGLGGVCTVLAEVKSNNVAIVGVVTNFRLIIVIFLGAWLLKERNHIYRKLTAAAAAIAGLTIMFWK
jgi:drug/metabolite transporter (DMT)-like permease